VVVHLRPKHFHYGKCHIGELMTSAVLIEREIRPSVPAIHPQIQRIRHLKPVLVADPWFPSPGTNKVQPSTYIFTDFRRKNHEIFNHKGNQIPRDGSGVGTCIAVGIGSTVCECRALWS
jgi:hypothetical protein